jgi:hypothetical protein
MFGLFSRPTRRPRKTRRPSLRPALRVEALEARANPDTSPTLTAVTATWTNATQVVISGTVTDTTSPTTVLVGGAASTSVTTTATGTFTTTLNLDQSGGTILLAAQPTLITSPTPVTIIAQGQPVLSNVKIQLIDGVWHITGQVVGGNPVGTVITIISSIPGVNGQTNVVDNADGTFDIGIYLPDGTPGGSISISLGDGNGNTFDQWDSSIG